jgi:fatty acid desaturase
VNQESTVFTEGWVWGAIWVFYAYFYGLYFGRIANRLKPDLNFVKTPGSPERLHAKQAWCYRFAVFMLFPTLLESISSSWFTSILISVLPCLFGIWVMHAVWREVLLSKLPQSKRPKQPQR